MTVRIDVTEEQRQMILLALAHLAVERPGWDHALNEVACKMDNVEEGRASLYESFRKLRIVAPIGAALTEV